MNSDIDERVEALLEEWEARRRSGEPASPEVLCESQPALLAELKRRIVVLQATDWLFPADTGANDARVPHGALPKQLGEYMILERHGAGGMGTVYKARHRRLDKLVALKVLPQVRTWDKQAVARFEREMRAAGKLEHPHIVSTFDAGVVDETQYLAMQLIDGLDVSRLVAMTGPLRVADACEIARQGALGLQYAHGHGLVHRDVKPSNLMLGRDGIVRLLDLGLARMEEPPAPGEEITMSGHVLGTLDYMPPEQFEDTSHVDPRGDVYSLGATLHKLLTGVSPLEQISGGTLRKMRAVADGDIRTAFAGDSQVPPHVQNLVKQRLAMNPADRPKSAREVAERLAAFSQGADLKRLIRSLDPTETIDATSMTRPFPHRSAVEGLLGETPQECATTVDEANISQTVMAPLPGTCGTRAGGRLRGKMVASLVALAFGLVLAVVILVETDRGTLVMTGEGVTVEQLKDAGVRLVHKQTGQSYDLAIGSQRQKSGDYLIEVTQTRSGLEFSTREFTIARGTSQEVKVTLKPPSPTGEALKSQRWAMIQELQKKGTSIGVMLPDRTSRAIQSADEIPSIHSIAFSGPMVTDESLEQLLEFSSPMELWLIRSGPIADLAVQAIGRQKQLTKLETNLVAVTNRQLAMLAGLKRLEWLMLWGSAVTDEGLPLLLNFPELRHLQLGESRGVSAAGLSVLQPLSKLRFLSLHGCGLGDEHLKLLKGLPQVTEWAIGGRSAWTNAGLKELESLAQIEKLWIDKCHLDDEGLKLLTKLPRLGRLDIQNTKVTREGISAFQAENPRCEVVSELLKSP